MQGETPDSIDDGMSNCDVTVADVTLRGNRAVIADWLYPDADPESSGPPSFLFHSSFLSISSSTVTGNI